jgi:hypothetical protein
MNRTAELNPSIALSMPGFVQLCFKAVWVFPFGLPLLSTLFSTMGDFHLQY